ncbi:MAG: class I SAM-dependent methyltransferase [Rhodospirillales bacterium]
MNDDDLKNAVRKTAPALALASHAYEERLRECGPTAKGVFWRDEDSVRLRFEMLLRVIRADDAAGRGLSAADFGCGYGALWDYIKDEPFMKGGAYAGYDISEAMTAEARARITDPRARFERRVLVSAPADYVFASGVFNMHMNADKQEWREYIYASLQMLWAQSRKGLAFNMLSEKKRGNMTSLYFADPDEVFAFCRKNLSGGAELIEDYDLPDFTVLVRRQRAAAR